MKQFIEDLGLLAVFVVMVLLAAGVLFVVGLAGNSWGFTLDAYRSMIPFGFGVVLILLWFPA